MRELQAWLFVSCMFFGLQNQAWAEGNANNCAQILIDAERLACYDQLLNTPVSSQFRKQENAEFDFNNTGSAFDFGEHKAASYLERTWELNNDVKTGLFRFRPYQPNILLLWRKSDSPNHSPSTPTQANPNTGTLLADELSYQLSFKTKLWQDIFSSPIDLWFAYTQQSYWQIYNQKASSPFRETNYEPELILTIPMHNTTLLGLNLKIINIGIAHQSNGRSRPYSRSWNRLYVQATLEKNDFLISVRAWQRFHEVTSNDDNPDISKFMSHGDIQATWFGEVNTVSALARYNISNHKGAFKLDWSFPLRGHLKGYAELFTGYGDTLIDYNHRQSIFGLGLLISTWP